MRSTDVSRIHATAILISAASDSLDRPIDHKALAIDVQQLARIAFSDPELQGSKRSSREPSRAVSAVSAVSAVDRAPDEP
jgi:hypothetical protein